jgi:hypothetical protein
LKVIFKGVRCSGRAITLLGNTITSIVVVYHAFKEVVMYLVVKGDDAVIFVRITCEQDVLDLAKERLTRLGFKAKLFFKTVDDVEFCSSYIMPSSGGFILTPKPGKLLAKTFWCKNTNFNKSQILEQFSGMVNGLRTNLSHVPVMKGLLRRVDVNPKATAFRKQYNEYAVQEHSATYETYEWFSNHYDVSMADVVRAEEYIATAPFPVDLSKDPLFEIMIKKDWSDANNDEFKYRAEEYVSVKDMIVNVLVAPVVEETVKFYTGILGAVLIGGIESAVHGGMYHMIAHLLLYLIGQQSLYIAIMLHVIHNYFCSTGAHNLSSFEITMAQKKKKNSQPNNSKKKKTSKKQPLSQRNRGLKAYADMLLDPCEAEMKDGLYSTSEGMLNKLKTFTGTSTTNNSGYILWDPSFTSVGQVSGKTFNALYYSCTGPGDIPVNTTSNPFGTNIATSTLALQVGAAAFAQSDTIADARCVGACMRITYKGRMDACSGIYGLLSNIPVASVLGPGGTDPISPNSLFQSAESVERFGTDPIEIRFTPAEYSSVFRSNSEGLFNYTTGAVTTVTNEATVAGARLMGIVFDDITSTADIRIEFFQNIEWRPNLGSGFTTHLPRQINSPGHFQKVLEYLDRTHPKWRTDAMRGAASLAGMISKAAFTGTLGANPALYLT